MVYTLVLLPLVYELPSLERAGGQMGGLGKRSSQDRCTQEEVLTKASERSGELPCGDRTEQCYTLHRASVIFHNEM
uniref:Putative secreted protein n=1 Tax=Anopheles darlingi TaxID=43151 RepID=A0A2M4DI26_ANODA